MVCIETVRFCSVKWNKEESFEFWLKEVNKGQKEAKGSQKNFFTSKEVKKKSKKSKNKAKEVKITQKK